MLLKSIFSIIVCSIVFLSIPVVLFNTIQTHSNIIGLFVNLRYEKLNAFTTKTTPKIIPQDHTITIYSPIKESNSFDFNCTVDSNRDWFGFTENLTSQIAGSIYFYCFNRLYKISFPVGKSLIRLYQF
jgi:hypothetical protein